MKTRETTRMGSRVRRRATGMTAVLLLVLLGFGVGCGGETTKPPGPSASELTAEGWTAFSAGDTATADARFRDALAVDPSYADAHTGRGWVAIRGRDYDGAETHFAAALAADSTARDAQAGRTVAAAGRDDPATVRDTGLALLEAVPEYRFAHDPEVSASDIRWLVARAALDLGDYVTAVAQIEVLAPGSGLNPDAADFLEEALALLESLRGEV